MHYNEYLCSRINASYNIPAPQEGNMYQDSTVYIIGDSKTSSNNPIMQKYNGFFIALVIDRDTHKIEDAECSSTIGLTSLFVKSLFAGKSMLEEEGILSEIEARYFGSSQKALMVAFKNASIKYKQIAGINLNV
ncbi:hypothetical protein B14911_21608 [Bacillus sp. NRRL B-14911]|nr:hypothetical protein B14911_21608 [Bacillus sp. NRRL B-14911]